MTLLTYRSELGLSLEQTAVQLGLRPSSKGWLSEIENGKKAASIRLAMRIERWSGGKVPAASVCPELAEHPQASPAIDDHSVSQSTAPVTLAKPGALQ